MANDSIYGWRGRVVPRHPAGARGPARLRAGTVWINDYHLFSAAAPFGGYKQSGVGRELGPWGLYEYLQTKYVRVDQTPDQGPEVLVPDHRAL